MDCQNQNEFQVGYRSMDTMYNVSVTTMDDYNSLTNEKGKITVPANKAIVYCSEALDDKKQIVLNNQKFDFEQMTKKQLQNSSFIDQVGDGYNYLIVILPDRETLYSVAADFTKEEMKMGSTLKRTVEYNYRFNIEGSHKNLVSFCKNLKSQLKASQIKNIEDLRDAYTSRQGYLDIYASLFFIGIFIGTMFLITTVLIIYYKQISEGYEDRDRFEILKKVGMSEKEVKKVIHSQIIQVFFLPIIIAAIHIIFAFQIIRRMLALLFLTKVSVFVACTIGCILIFSVVYGIVYMLTAKAYYKIVYGENA